MRVRFFLITAATAAALGAYGCTSDTGLEDTAEVAPMEQPATDASSGMYSSDREFLAEAAEGGMAEVEVGQLAQEHGSSAQVKEIGEMLVEDHSAANEKLRAIASGLQIDLPQEASSSQKSELEDLAGMTGESFDRGFVEHGLEDHEKDIDAFSAAAQQAENQQVREFASQTLPTLREHHQRLQQAAQAMGMDAGMGADTPTQQP